MRKGSKACNFTFNFFNRSLSGLSRVAYGVSGTVQSITELTQQPLAASGIETYLMSAFPFAGVAGYLSVVNIFSSGKHIYDVLYDTKSMNKVSECLPHVLVISVSSLTLAACIYEGQSHAVNAGVATFGLVCDALALQAITLFLCTGCAYIAASKERDETKQKMKGKTGEIQNQMQKVYEEADETCNLLQLQLIYNLFNAIAWITLALAHVASLAAAAPVLVAVGSTILGALGATKLYGLYQEIRSTESTGKLQIKPS